ncbi:MAG TPA: SCO family protein [Acidimicrobiales bacterium]|nr:SCO family protein [Acidimicrobiales bacterium]
MSRDDTGPAVSTEEDDRQPDPPQLSEAERAAAFRRSEPKVPPKFALIVVAVLVGLGVGGTLLEHLLSSVGLNPGATTAGQTTATTSAPGLIAPPGSAPSAPEMGAPLPQFMGISPRSASAPNFSLEDQAGHLTSLADERGHAVVLTFFDGPCQDICPVVSAEVVQAADDLGSAASRVVFLTVNTDPLALSSAPASTAAVRTGLGSLATWHFLTSNLTTLNAVWRAYGVSVNVSRTSGIVAHNDVMYFVDPSGRLRYEATPFANENPTGGFSLPPASIARWGQGIATYARQSLGETP